jgi:hypothetical protein
MAELGNADLARERDRALQHLHAAPGVRGGR